MKNPNPDPQKHLEIPVWNAENWFYEDIVIGQRQRSIRRTKLARAFSVKL